MKYKAVVEIESEAYIGLDSKIFEEVMQSLRREFKLEGITVFLHTCRLTEARAREMLEELCKYYDINLAGCMAILHRRGFLEPAPEPSALEKARELHNNIIQDLDNFSDDHKDMLKLELDVKVNKLMNLCEQAIKEEGK